MANRLPFHPFVLVLSMISALLLVTGILGALEVGFLDGFPVLKTPLVWGTLIALGGILTIAEVMVVVLGARSRSNDS